MRLAGFEACIGTWPNESLSLEVGWGLCFFAWGLEILLRAARSLGSEYETEPDLDSLDAERDDC